MLQEIRDIERLDLLNKTLDMKNAGYRLAQICATKWAEAPKPEGCILLYSFIKDEKLVTLRLIASVSDPMESVSCLYSYAFLYENEMKDLFGIQFLNLNLDFNGHLYKTSVKTPFHPARNEVKDSE